MRILVVGPGAIGSLFAGMLTSGGHEVWLLGRRREAVDTINREGITIEQVWTGATLRILVRATVDPCDAAPAELIVMCVKSPGTLQATRDALPAAADWTVFLTVQNGLGNVDTMASVVGPERGRRHLQRHDAAGTGLHSTLLDGRHHHRRVGRPSHRETGAGGRGLPAIEDQGRRLPIGGSAALDEAREQLRHEPAGCASPGEERAVG